MRRPIMRSQRMSDRPIVEQLEARELLSGTVSVSPDPIDPHRSIKVTGLGYEPRTAVQIVIRQDEQVLATEREWVFSAGEISRRVWPRPDPHPGNLSIEVWTESVDVLLAKQTVSVFDPSSPTSPVPAPPSPSQSLPAAKLSIEVPPTPIREFEALPITVQGGLGNTELVIEVWRDGLLEFRLPGFHETDQNGHASLTIEVPQMLTGGSLEDAFTVSATTPATGDNTEAQVLVLRGQRVWVSENKVQEGKPFHVGVSDGVGETEIRIDLAHDGQLLHEYRYQQTDGSGDANVELTMLTGILGAAQEDTFTITVTTGHRPPEEFKMLVTKGPTTSSGPAENIGSGIGGPTPTLNAGPLTQIQSAKLPPTGFVHAYQGAVLDGKQCVPAARALSIKLSGRSFPFLGPNGRAYQLWGMAVPGFEKVSYAFGRTPSPGSLIIWKPTGANLNSGHVAIALGSVRLGVVRVADANWGLNLRGQIHDVQLSTAIYGWLKPV